MEDFKTSQCGTGRLWKKKTRSGNTFYSGLINITKDGSTETYHINIFLNNLKDRRTGSAGLGEPDCRAFIYPARNNLTNSNPVSEEDWF